MTDQVLTDAGVGRPGGVRSKAHHRDYAAPVHWSAVRAAPRQAKRRKLPAPAAAKLNEGGR